MVDQELYMNTKLIAYNNNGNLRFNSNNYNTHNNNLDDNDDDR